MDMASKRIKKSERGSVMMEYLILNLGFFVVLALSAHFLLPDFSDRTIYDYTPETGAFVEKGNAADSGRGGAYGKYGLLGSAFIKHYNMVLDIVSMPYP